MFHNPVPVPSSSVIFINLHVKPYIKTGTTDVVRSSKPLTMVGKCRTYTSADKPEPRENPPNITACSSSIMVREKAEQGGGLDPLTDGDDHDPKGRES